MKKLIEKFKTWLIINREKYEYYYDILFAVFNFFKTVVYCIGLFFLINSLLGTFENLYYLRNNIATSKFNYYTYETLQHLINVLCLYYLTNKLKDKDGE